MTSDPMSLRRGGKKLPMEDVCYYHWPLPGIDQVFTFWYFSWYFSASTRSNGIRYFLCGDIAVWSFWHLWWTWWRWCSQICKQVSLLFPSWVCSCQGLWLVICLFSTVFTDGVLWLYKINVVLIFFRVCFSFVLFYTCIYMFFCVVSCFF